MEHTFLEIKDLTVRYTSDGQIVHAVNGAGLTLERGQTLGLVGETGAGKTTLGRMVLQLQGKTAGKIFFDGKDVSNVNKKEWHARAMTCKLFFRISCPHAELRKAVAYAIDNAAFSAVATLGNAPVAQAMGVSVAGDLTQETFDLYKDTGYYAYDLEKAKECVANANIPEGTVIKMSYGYTAGHNRLAEDVIDLHRRGDQQILRLLDAHLGQKRGKRHADGRFDELGAVLRGKMQMLRDAFRCAVGVVIDDVVHNSCGVFTVVSICLRHVCRVGIVPHELCKENGRQTGRDAVGILVRFLQLDIEVKNIVSDAEVIVRVEQQIVEFLDRLNYVRRDGLRGNGVYDAKYAHRNAAFRARSGLCSRTCRLPPRRGDGLQRFFFFYIISQREGGSKDELDGAD